MPNITEFDAGALQVRPTEIGVESQAAAGRRLGAYGSQIAGSLERTGAEAKTAVDAAEKYVAHREINTGAAQAATFVANKNKQLNDFLTGADIDPNDPQRQDKITARINNPQAINQFREQNLEPAFEQFSQGFVTQQGRDWFERWQDSYRNHVLEHGTAVQSSMAGAVVQANTEKTINALTAASFNDPSSLAFNKDMLKHALEGNITSSPTLSAEGATKVREELTLRGEEALVKSAIQGAIIKGGNWQSIANDPKNADYIKPAENLAFVRQEQMYQRMSASEARTARIQQDYINKQNFNTQADKLEIDTIPKAPGQPPVLPNDYWERVKQIGMMPGVDPGRLRSLITNGEHLTDKLGKPEPLGPISHATTIQAMNDLRAGKSVDIGALYGSNQLNNADYGFLAKAIEERKTPEGERLDKDRDLFFKRYSMMIDPTMGEHGDRLYNAEMDARRKEQDLIAHNLDPHLAYDPHSKEFLGNPAQVAKWKQPLQQDITPPPDTTPERPKQFPADAQWDAARKYWYVMQDGKKFRVEPTGGPSFPTIPLSQ